MRVADWPFTPAGFGGVKRIRSFLAANPERATHLRPLCLCLGLTLGALISTAGNESVWVLGFKLPPLCPFKVATGLDCPGCGITRALIFAFHGRFHDAYMMHLWGIPLAMLILAQIPYRITLIALNRPSPTICPATLRPWINRFVFLSILFPWIAKMAFLIPIRWF